MISTDILQQIKLKEQRLADKTAAIAQLQYEKELIEKDIVDAIKTELNNSCINIFAYYNPGILGDIWRWWKNRDKEENKQLKASLDYILSIIKSKLLNNDDNFILKNIYDCNYSSAYEFVFDYKGKEILVHIPVFSNITKENKPYIMCGYMVQYTKNENVWALITRGFDTNKISQDLKEWLNEK